MPHVTCADLLCGIEFEIPDHVYRQARIHVGRKIYCPNGHWMAWQKSINEELKEENEGLKREVAALCGRLEVQRRLAVYWKGVAHRKKGKP